MNQAAVTRATTCSVGGGVGIFIPKPHVRVRRSATPTRRAACVCSLRARRDFDGEAPPPPHFQKEVNAFRAILAGTALGALVAGSSFLRPLSARAAPAEPLPNLSATAVTAVIPAGTRGNEAGVVGATLEDSDTAVTARANRVTAAQWAQYKARPHGATGRIPPVPRAAQLSRPPCCLFLTSVSSSPPRSSTPFSIATRRSPLSSSRSSPPAGSLSAASSGAQPVGCSNLVGAAAANYGEAPANSLPPILGSRWARPG